MQRYFLPETLVPSTTYTLDEGESRHLLRVMRAKQGEKITLTNGQGTIAVASLTELSAQAKVTVESVNHSPRPTPSVALIQALLKPQKLDLLVEKTTELGVDDIYLYPAMRSSYQELSPSKLSRLHQIAVSAMKQSKRAYLPTIHWLPSLSALPPLPSLLYGVPKAEAPSLQVEKGEAVGLVVGPEGGFTKEEEQQLHTLKANPISFNINVLRSETAAIVGIGLVCHLTRSYNTK